MQIVLTRDNANIPWGFRLKGGAEYNVPLSILKVNEGSPAHYRLECGDIIQTIGNYPALNLKHEEALNLIRMFDLTLPLIIQRPIQQSAAQSQFQMNPSRVGPISMNKPAAVWRPPSQIAASQNSQPYQPAGPPVHAYQYQPQPQSHPQQQPVYHQYQPPHTQPQPAYHQYQTPQPQFAQNITSSTFSNVPSSPRTPASSSYYQAPQNTFNYPANEYQSDYHQRPVSYQYQPTSVNVMGTSNTSTTGMPSSLLMMNAPQPTSPRLLSSPDPHSPNSLGSLSAASSSAPPPPPAPAGPPPPPAPPLPSSFNSVNNYRANQTSASPSSHASASTDARASGAVPDALLKALNASPMGKKPFTYTPGGLDLSHVRQSARVRRYESMNSGERVQHAQHPPHPGHPSHPMHHHGPQPTPPPHMNNFSNSYDSYQKQSTSQTNLSNFPSSYSNTPSGVVSVQAPSTMSTHQRLNSASMNNFESGPSQAPRLQRQPSGSGGGPMGFNVTPEQLIRPSRAIVKDEPKDMSNQSFSFKMLNKWIAESETQPIQLRSKKDEEEEQQQQQQQASIRKSEVIKAIEEEEKRGFHVRNSQSPQTVAPRMNAVPSKTFQYLDRKFSESDSGPYGPNRRTSQADEHPYQDNHPARERDQENQPQKYRGANIPSRTFKYLQYLTQNELVTDEKPHQTNPSSSHQSSDDQSAKPVLRTATAQVAPERLNALGRKNSIDQQKQSMLPAASMNNNHLHATSNFPNSFANGSNGISVDPSMTQAEPKSLGVKSMMSRFNNISNNQPVSQPGSHFPKHVEYTANSASNMAQFAHPVTASTFSHQPLSGAYLSSSPPPQSTVKPTAINLPQPAVDNSSSDTRQVDSQSFLQNQQTISYSTNSSSSVEAAHDSCANTATEYHPSLTEPTPVPAASSEPTASQPVSDEQAASLSREETQPISEVPEVAKTETASATTAANVEIAETNHTTDAAEIAPLEDSNTLSLSPADTTILNNEIINTNINLNNEKNEQQQEQEQKQESSAQQEQTQEQPKTTEAAPVVQEESKVEASAPLTQTENAESAQEVVETSEF